MKKTDEYGGMIVDEPTEEVKQAARREKIRRRMEEDVERENAREREGMDAAMDEEFVDSLVGEQVGLQTDVGFRLDLVDAGAMLRLGNVLKKGLERYPNPDNWKYIGPRDHVNHALGHLLVWLMDYPRTYFQRDAPDQLAKAMCRVMFAIGTEGSGGMGPQRVTERGEEG